MIELKNVFYTYNKDLPTRTQILNGINMHIKKNTISAVIGHTGSGKSTLIRLFNGLLKPDSGTVSVDGEDLSDKKTDLRKIRQKVGMVFQYPEHQLFEESVYKDIAFGPKNMGLDEAEIKKRVEEAMEIMKLPSKYKERSPFDLSGGEKRRAAIAGVIAMKPEALILDEPAAGLDPRGRDEILSVIKNYYKNNGSATVVFVSHSMEDVAETADYIFAVDDGKISMEGSVGEVFSQTEKLLRMGLCPPQITQLTAYLNEHGFELDKDIYTVKYGAEKIFEALTAKKERI